MTCFGAGSALFDCRSTCSNIEPTFDKWQLSPGRVWVSTRCLRKRGSAYPVTRQAGRQRLQMRPVAKAEGDVAKTARARTRNS